MIRRVAGAAAGILLAVLIAAVVIEIVGSWWAFRILGNPDEPRPDHRRLLDQEVDRWVD